MVYKAEFHGFGVHDAKWAGDADSWVTPLSKVPRSGDKVKTDWSDAPELVERLEEGSLRRCHVLIRQLRTTGSGRGICCN
ncbi:MAG: hypothetical protein Kow0074_02320 [Candidatus Zixiibacteriota bacterium]